MSASLASPAPQPLPRGPRRAAMVGLFLCGLVGLMAFGEFARLVSAAELVALPAGAAPAVDSAAAVLRGQLEGMRTARTLVLFALSMACAFAFGASRALLHARGVPRDRLRQLAANGLLAAGVLRVFDGAQEAALSRSLGHVVAADLPRALAESPVAPEVLSRFQALLPSMGVVIATGQTVVMAGALVLLGQYLRSERAQKAVAAADGGAAA